jgi:hypothetical protein
MESLESPDHNCYMILSDGVPEGALGAVDVIRIGVDFDARTISITETETDATSVLSVPEVTPDLLDSSESFRLEYDSLRNTLRFRDLNAEVSHLITGTHGDLDRVGSALESDAAANFSSIQRHLVPLSPPSSPSWTNLDMTADSLAGVPDNNGNDLGGTEALSLITHKEKLYAGIGYWNDLHWGAGSPYPYPGAQVLVKDAAGVPWRQDVAFGEEHLRVESLESITITTDKEGALLASPVTLLLAGTGPPVVDDAPLPTEVSVFIRNDDTGDWTRTSLGHADPGNFPTARLIFDHVDRVTVIHHVFCGYGSEARLVKGAYDKDTGLIE